MMPDTASGSLVGRQIAGYRVLALVGAGGVGEVYRARDMRLGRDVALKILQRDRADDPVQQARFLREAQAASALNHPNILAVYDVGVEDGMPFIVSELIDGTSLREAVDRAPLPIKELLNLATQIAEGLTAAHEADIVHRDLKPENVMVTRDGRAKILDFGLAKTPPPQAPSDGSTLRVTRTETGLIQGTVPYMSPEQARGAAADFRSDQFSLGLVLYEMTTGTQAFRRETPVQTLSAIIADEASPIADLNPRAPAPLRWLIERCLAKDPSQRYAATRDLAQDLHTLRHRLAEAIAGTAAFADESRARSRKATVALALVAVAAIGASAVFLSAALRLPGLDVSSQRLTPLATEAGYQGMPAFSPVDGTLAYIGEVNGVEQVFKRDLTSKVSQRLTDGVFDCRDPFWASNGSRVYYISAMGDGEGLRSVSSAGGPSTAELEDVSAAAISPNGKTLALLREEPGKRGYKALWTASPPGAEPVRYEKPPFDTQRFWSVAMHFSPDGLKLGIWVQGTGPLGGKKNDNFWIVPLPTGEPHSVDALSKLPPSWPAFAWLPDNRHLIVAAQQPGTLGTHLWWMDTSGRDATQRITSTTIKENYPAVSRPGDMIAFASENDDYDVIEIPLDKLDKSPRSLLATTRSEMDPAWSPGGTQYAYVTDRMGPQQIWRRSLDSLSMPSFDLPVVTESDFPDGPTYVFSAPVFSPNGQQIAYERHGIYNSIWISPAAGGGRPQPLWPGVEYFQGGPTWAPTGPDVGSIAFVTSIGGQGELVKVQVGGATSTPLAKNVNSLTQPQWSPDGHWIACETDNPKGLSLVSPDPRAGSPRLVSEESWLVYGWSDDSTKLYGIRRSDDQRHLVLASLDIATKQERVLKSDLGPVPLATYPLRGFSRMSSKSFATSILSVRSTVWLLEGFKPPLGVFERLMPEWLRPGR
jgi:Tol biopolymer transport system component